jgi:hypothetical protein
MSVSDLCLTLIGSCASDAHLPEVVQTLGGEGVVVPLPRELGLDESLGGQGLHGLDDLQVSDVGDIGVSGSVEVLLSDHDSLCELE